jgi:hypothetical protein
MKRQRVAQSFLVLSFALFALSSALPLYATGVVSASLAGARAYPNPWRADKHANTLIKFDNMPAASTVKIFTVSAHEVKTLSADSSGMAPWDRTNDSGDRVASGVYIYLVIDPQGNETSGKIAVIN